MDSARKYVEECADYELYDMRVVVARMPEWEDA